jgi:hypothetical protein
LKQVFVPKVIGIKQHLVSARLLFSKTVKKRSEIVCFFTQIYVACWFI